MSVLLSQGEVAQSVVDADNYLRQLLTSLRYTLRTRLPVAPPRKGVADLPSTLMFQVTDEDIALGIRHHATECPRVRAIRRQLFLQYGLDNRDVHIHVNLGDFLLMDNRDGTHRSYKVRSQDFLSVMTYDMVGYMRPHTFSGTSK